MEKEPQAHTVSLEGEKSAVRNRREVLPEKSKGRSPRQKSQSVLGSDATFEGPNLPRRRKGTFNERVKRCFMSL